MYVEDTIIDQIYHEMCGIVEKFCLKVFSIEMCKHLASIVHPRKFFISVDSDGISVGIFVCPFILSSYYLFLREPTLHFYLSWNLSSSYSNLLQSLADLHFLCLDCQLLWEFN